jgi:transposase-like protein
MNITWSIEMPDFDKWEFELSCPICRLDNTITMGQVRREEYFICRGCHNNIKAIDQLGDIQRVKGFMQNIFK